MLTRPHVPYRNSILTAMLKDSLGGNCSTAMLATISSEGSQLEESIATCRFAQRVAMITNEVCTLLETDLMWLPSLNICKTACSLAP